MLYFTIQNRLQDGTSKVSEAAGARWRFCVRIILELCSNYPRIVFLLAEAFRELALKSGAFRFRGRRTIWWGCRVTLLAPRIGNDLSYVTQISDDIHFAWQAQYLVMLEGDFTCSAQWQWRFICRADLSSNSFCVAGAVFGEVGGWLFVTGAALRDILGDSWDAKCCILQYKIVPKLGRVRSPKRRVRDDDFVLDYPRIMLELSSNRLSIGGSIQGVSAEIWRFQISWQVHYLVRVQGDFTCSTHWKWRFICDADQWWHSFCVAGAVFGDVGGRLYLLRAVEMTFHMSRGSFIKFILRGRRSIWWGWRVTFRGRPSTSWHFGR